MLYRAACSLLGVMGIDPGDNPTVVDLAAVGAAKMAWRSSPVEDWHRQGWRGITDVDMLRINVATTRVVRNKLDQLLAEGRPFTDLGLIARPNRRLPGGLSVSDLAVTHSDLLALRKRVDRTVTLWTELAKRHGARSVCALLACIPGYADDLWWLMPWWPSHVDEFIRRLQNPAQAPTWARPEPPDSRPYELSTLRAALLEGPDNLSRAAADFCLSAGLGYSISEPLRHLPRAPFRSVIGLLDPDLPAKDWPDAYLDLRTLVAGWSP